MSKSIPSEITWNGLKRIKVQPESTYLGVEEIRIGPKAFRLRCKHDVLRFQKFTNAYGQRKSSEVKITFIDTKPPQGVLRTLLTLYLNTEEAETLGQWLLDGKYLPPQRRST